MNIKAGLADCSLLKHLLWFSPEKETNIVEEMCTIPFSCGILK